MGQLVCGIGNYISNLQDVALDLNRMMPLQEAEFGDSLFQVGRNVTFNASFTGELVCFANDANGLYFNNKGILNVTVSRLSWPPLRGGFKCRDSRYTPSNLHPSCLEHEINATKWPLRYRWPPMPFFLADDYD